jgi:hypothetical protein
MAAGAGENNGAAQHQCVALKEWRRFANAASAMLSSAWQ